MIPIILLVFGAAVLIGIVRRASAVGWIWLLFGAVIVMLVLWVLLIVFVVGPEMHRTGAPGVQPR